MEEDNPIKILTGKPIGNIPLGRPRRRSEENIRMDIKEIGTNSRNWIDSALDKSYLRSLGNAALSLRVQCATELVSTRSVPGSNN